MIAPISNALTHRAAGPAASAVALVLAGMLAASWSHAARREGELKAQVDALAARAEQQGVYWKAQLSACRAEAAPPAAPRPRLEVTRIADDAEAARLASQGPAGFDVCARMEAADQAVLASLHAK